MKNKKILYIILFIIFIMMIINFLSIILNPLFFIIFLILIIFGIIGYIIGSIKGWIVGNYKLKKEENEIKDSNPFIYFRELPNNFGIGIASLLIDSEIENDKDIVATILDLCAKKYLTLEKINEIYTIKILKDCDEKLFSNEKYVLENIKNKNLKNFNYQKWLDLCMQDGISLGLYYQRDEKNFFKEKNINYNPKKHFKFCIIFALLIVILEIILGIIFGIKNQNFIINFTMIIVYAFKLLIYTIIIFPISYFIYAPFLLIKAIFNSGLKRQNVLYKHILNSKLKKTQKGKEELHKLYAFKNFIEDFGNFADKKTEEIVLWDYYLSYAQLFGLSKEIMKTGYKELIKNSSFIIDEIDNINLDNISIN